MASLLYPVGLNLKGRKGVVVGGGAVGARKAFGLIEAGAAVIVVALEASEEVRGAAARGELEYREAAFTAGQLDGAFLVVAATDSAAVNAAVVAAARERGVLVNVAGDAEGEDGGDFVTMAAVRRGNLLLALTTGGAGPALTARLRRELETAFGPEWAEYVELLGKMRRKARIEIADPNARADALRRLAANDRIRAKLAAGDATGAETEATSCL